MVMVVVVVVQWCGFCHDQHVCWFICVVMHYEPVFVPLTAIAITFVSIAVISSQHYCHHHNWHHYQERLHDR